MRSARPEALLEVQKRRQDQERVEQVQNKVDGSSPTPSNDVFV